jgi:hypothetical protein
VPAELCSAAWDIDCFAPGPYALGVAFPAAAAATSQPWSPPSEWAIAIQILRGLAWIFTALLLAGVTGLLRKQT